MGEGFSLRVQLVCSDASFVFNYSARTHPVSRLDQLQQLSQYELPQIDQVREAKRSTSCGW